jgi:hypothetical protein
MNATQYFNELRDTTSAAERASLWLALKSEDATVRSELYTLLNKSVSGLLSISSDAKTVKGQEIGYATAVMYLAPAREGGIGNLCSNASDQCTQACLYTAGRGIMSSVQFGRIKRTWMYWLNKEAFLIRLHKEIAAFLKSEAKDVKGLTKIVRLNGTSDIMWEQGHSVTIGNVRYASIFDAFSSVSFYDYTKIAKRLMHQLPANYSLTFSRSENNHATCIALLNMGFTVAAVFSTRKGEALPTHYEGFEVINGDESDVRINDPKGVWVGLLAKGFAKNMECGGFVIDPEFFALEIAA